MSLGKKEMLDNSGADSDNGSVEFHEDVESDDIFGRYKNRAI